MQNHSSGLLLVLSGPSGSGKDTLLGELEQGIDDLQLSVSLTTRPRRNWEQDGVHYTFVTRAVFEQKLRAGDILEHTQYNGNYYGTPKSAVDAWLAQGKTVVLKIEVEGAARIRALYPGCVSVFLLPPSLQVLTERLVRRESEDAAEIRRRVAIAHTELQHARDYDYVLLNDVLEHAAGDFRAVIRAERQRACRREALLAQVLGDVAAPLPTP